MCVTDCCYNTGIKNAGTGGGWLLDQFTSALIPVAWIPYKGQKVTDVSSFLLLIFLSSAVIHDNYGQKPVQTLS